jgi:formyl-CoA transferase
MLEDLRIIEVGQIIAGPFAGAILADLGATVIKIERPDGGDDGRRFGKPYLDDDSLTFHEFNRGKRSIALDLKTPEGVAALHRLADGADALIHNLRPDVPAELGIGPDEFCKQHPRLIYCEISGFGQNGPMRNDPAFEPLVQAMSGLITVNGDPAGPPSRLPISVLDRGAGMWLVIGLLAALRERDRTGRGCVVHASLFDTAMSWLSQRIAGFLNEHVEHPREPNSGNNGLVPYQTFTAADGDFMVCVGSDRVWAKFCAKNRARLENRKTLVPLMAEIFVQQPRAYWVERFHEMGVPAEPVNTLRESLALEQFAATGILAPPMADVGMRLVALPLTFDGKRPYPHGIGPKLGADNDLLAVAEGSAS